MPDAADPPQPDPSKPGPLVTVKDKPVILIGFLLFAAALLGGDLWLKAWSFERIGSHPIRLASSSDGPIVFIQPDFPVPPDLLVDGAWVRADQVYENMPGGAVPPHDPTVAVPGLLNFQLTLNTGAVFGLGKGARWLFIVVSVFATAIIFIMVWRSPAQAYAYHAALAMILAGALGNLYDRVRFSAVRDMLHMLPGTRLWPWIFNFADVALVVGVGLVLVLSFVSERRQRIAESAAG